MVLSATFRTVLSSTIAIRLVIRTPRMIHRRRYTFMSVSASGATAEAPACGETPRCSIVSLRGPRSADTVAPWPVHPGTASGRPGKANDTEQVRIAINSCRAATSPQTYGCPMLRRLAPRRALRGGYPRPGEHGILKSSGDATTAPRGRRISMTAQPSDSGAAATKARTAELLYGGSASRRVTVRDLAAAKARGEKWPMLTAYDALTARVFDDAGIPVLLVGDSAAMVVYGHDTTIPVTVDDLIPLTAAVVRGTRRAMVVADLPFGS